MRSVELNVTVVVPDHVTDGQVINQLAGRTLPGLPGSWIAEVQQHLPAPDLTPQDTPDLFDDVIQAELDADAGL